MTTWSIDYAFMIDNGDLCTKEEMERVGWDKNQRYSVGKRGSGHWRNPCTSCLGKRKRRPVDSWKDTRYAHVGNLGKTAVEIIRGSKSSRNIA